MINKNIIFNVINSISSSLLITDSNSKIIYSNKYFEDSFGFNQKELLGKKPSILKSKATSTKLYNDIKLSLKENSEWQGEIWNKDKNGITKPYWVIINEVRDQKNRLENYFAIYIDMNKKNKNLYELAHYDELTGLANRTLLNKTLEEICATKDNGKSAILFIDIDNFKSINDSHGHLTGDYTLQEIANIIKSTLREQDTVARISGDEFVICINQIKNKKDVDVYLKRLLNAFELPLVYENKELIISLSIGISIYPDDTEIKEKLIHYSDQAMYKVKKNGKNGFEFFKE